MPAGRPNKPAEVLKLHGDYREDRHGGRGPKTGGEPLRKPDDLDEIAADHWDMICQKRAAWLAGTDAPALETLCWLWSAWRRLRALWMADLNDKNTRCNALAAEAEWSKLAARFGLSPSDRARLGEGADAQQEKAELENMLA